MKVFKSFTIGFLFGAAAFSQTLDLGSNIFYSEEGAINLAVDAGVAVRKLDSPYIMLVLYMGTDPSVQASVNRQDITLVYEGKEYSLPSFKDYRKDYRDDRKDWNMYMRLGREPLIMSRMNRYKFPPGYDFFPARNDGSRVTDEGFVSPTIGFITRLYFKNPGFKKGDAVQIVVRDKKDPEIWGSVAVEF